VISPLYNNLLALERSLYRPPIILGPLSRLLSVVPRSSMAAVARSSYGAATDPPPSAPLPYNNAPSAAFTTVAELRALAKQNTKQAIKGASPLTCVSLTQKLADDAQLCEDSGDFSGAFFKYIQASKYV
jgi:hypothetical protein